MGSEIVRLPFLWRQYLISCQTWINGKTCITAPFWVVTPITKTSENSTNGRQIQQVRWKTETWLWILNLLGNCNILSLPLSTMNETCSKKPWRPWETKHVKWITVILSFLSFGIILSYSSAREILQLLWTEMNLDVSEFSPIRLIYLMLLASAFLP